MIAKRFEVRCDKCGQFISRENTLSMEDLTKEDIGDDMDYVYAYVHINCKTMTFTDYMKVPHKFYYDSVQTYASDQVGSHSLVYLIMRSGAVREMFLDHQRMCNFIVQCSPIMMQNLGVIDIDGIIGKHKELQNG